MLLDAEMKREFWVMSLLQYLSTQMPSLQREFTNTPGEGLWQYPWLRLFPRHCLTPFERTSRNPRQSEDHWSGCSGYWATTLSPEPVSSRQSPTSAD